MVRIAEVQAGGKHDFEPVAFPTFAPIALAGIGHLAATIEDRSVRIQLQRQESGQKRARVGLKQLRGLRERISPHLMAHADAIGRAMADDVPDNLIPPSLNDRDADNWRPLLALAKLAGPEWLTRAQHAATALCQSDTAGGDRSNEYALGQVVEFITERRRAAVEEWREWVNNGRKSARSIGVHSGVRQPVRCDFITSDALAAWLLAKDDSGFADMRDAGAVKLRVARLLRAFTVRPKQRSVNGKSIRGYGVATIRAVWRRYQP